MASFARLSTWSVGYFRAFSSHLLKARRDVAARVAVIDAEVTRIGFVKVYYRVVEDADGGNKVTQERMGFSVSPGSSLEMLVRAFIARGGNPLDISGFLMPDTGRILDSGVFVQEYPEGGVAAPRSANYNNPASETDDSGYGDYRGGYVPLDGYHARRLGGRTDRGGRADGAVVNTMLSIRGWADQEIKALQRMEWQIVKLMDLREQLQKEKNDVLVQAFGGVLSIFDEFDDERYVRSHLVQNMVQDMYDTLFDTIEGGTVSRFKARGDVGLLEFTFPDKASEIRDPKGG